MFSTLIGVVLAFITVILLLSLVVMAFVQLTQSFLRLRARNLLVGVASFIEAEGLEARLPAPKSPRVQRGGRGKSVVTAQAAEIINATAAAKLRFADDPNTFRSVVRGPATSWAQASDVAAVIKEFEDRKQLRTPPPGPTPVTPAAPSTTPYEQLLESKFRALEPAMTDRFARHMQILTWIWGIVIALIFQVNAAELLSTLSKSEAKREAVLALVPSATSQAEIAVTEAMSNDFVDRALAELQRQYPGRTELANSLRSVSGSTDSRAEMLEELRNVLEADDVSDVETIVQSYSAIIDKQNTRDIKSAVATASTAIDSLEIIDIRPLGRNWEFYGRAGNWLGMALTAILLSFGAPFWFDQVKNIAGLRDALSRRKEA